MIQLSSCCNLDLLQQSFLDHNSPVIVSSFTSGYNGFSSHINQSAPYWCANNSQSGQEYIYFMFSRMMHITHISAHGGFINESGTFIPSNVSIRIKTFQNKTSLDEEINSTGVRKQQKIHLK